MINTQKSHLGEWQIRDVDDSREGGEPPTRSQRPINDNSTRSPPNVLPPNFTTPNPVTKTYSCINRTVTPQRLRQEEREGIQGTRQTPQSIREPPIPGRPPPYPSRSNTLPIKNLITLRYQHHCSSSETKAYITQQTQRQRVK